MREIKFRGWNKTKNRMDFFSGIFNKHPYTEMSTFPQYESCPEYHEFEIMEFTGLKDKNSKEIYEGDIIKVSHPHAELFGDDPYFFGEVFFRDGAFCHTFLEGRPSEQMWEYAEVVGNIYENPELLKGSAK